MDELIFVASCERDLAKFPLAVRAVMAVALDWARQGATHPDVKVLKGFGNAGVLEVREQDSGAAYRLVYTTQFAGFVYALHAFKKKSSRGIATPKKEMDKVRLRLKEAHRLHSERDG
jgi:phage-related protein